MRCLTFIFISVLVYSTVVSGANPAWQFLDSTSSLHRDAIYWAGTDGLPNPDADSAVAYSGMRLVVWAANAGEAAIAKSLDDSLGLILYCSVDHGLVSANYVIDTVDPGNEWCATADESSHFLKMAADSGHSYFDFFPHFAEETWIAISPWSRNGFTHYDTFIFLPADTGNIEDKDSMSVVPDTYRGTHWLAVPTDTVRVTVDGTDSAVVKRYVGTPKDGLVQRVALDFFNSKSVHAQRNYMLRAFSQEYNDLGGTGADVYGWGALSDSGLSWDGGYEDNFNPAQMRLQGESILVSGGLIWLHDGFVGEWNSDSLNQHFWSGYMLYSREMAAYLEDGANFWDNKPKMLSGNLGGWWDQAMPQEDLAWGFGDSLGLHVMLLEKCGADRSYYLDVYENSNYNGRSTAQVMLLDSLLQSGDKIIYISTLLNDIDTNTVCPTPDSAWGNYLDPLRQSAWLRWFTMCGNRVIWAAGPPMFFGMTTGGTLTYIDADTICPSVAQYRPCPYYYAAMPDSPWHGDSCNGPEDVHVLMADHPPFARNYDLGYRLPDSSNLLLEVTDSAGAEVDIRYSMWQRIDGVDTIYSFTYYFVRSLSGWDWRNGLSSDNHHAVAITPPDATYKRLEYDGSTTVINGADQRCALGHGLILTAGTAEFEPPGSDAGRRFEGITIEGIEIKND